MSGATHCHHGIPLHLPCRDCPGEVISSNGRNLPELLRDAERRLNAHIFKRGGDDALASIPANPDRDVDLLLMEAAAEIERLRSLLSVDDTTISYKCGECGAFHLRVLESAADRPVPEKADREMMQVLEERDRYHDYADELAMRIATMTESEIGEHSNMNNPWENALELSEAFIANRQPSETRDERDALLASATDNGGKP